MIWQKGIEVTDEMKVANQPTLRQRGYLSLSRWTQADHKGSVKWKREAQEENPGDGRMRTWPDIAGFNDRERVPELRNAGASGS